MKIKRYMWFATVAALVVLGMFAGSRRFAAAIVEEFDAGAPQEIEATPLVTLAQATRGVVFGTAAINLNGSIASCFNCVSASTEHLSAGRYQIAFNFASVTANNGWSRWVQVEDLSTGTAPLVHCSTADRAGVASAVYVQCYNGAGTLTDTPFFLFLAR